MVPHWIRWILVTPGALGARFGTQLFVDLAISLEWLLETEEERLAVEEAKADIAAGRVTPWEDVKRELGRQPKSGAGGEEGA
ncbi:MAG: hypothetical protein HY331_15660 [Chloroflexi bacterium]|nr:hypothetical protein [Chloroflexota bacterium]